MHKAMTGVAEEIQRGMGLTPVFEVYREMGCGFLEAVYQECLEKELHKRGIPFAAQHLF